MALTKFNNFRRRLNCAADGADRDELAAWAETIPFEELWDKIRELTGLADLSFNHTLSTAGSVSISFASQDLADRAGFLKPIFETLKIEEFNSSVLVRENNGIPTKLWWGTVCFHYTLPRGGRHRTTFMAFSYWEGEGWRFVDYSSDT